MTSIFTGGFIDPLSSPSNSIGSAAPTTSKTKWKAVHPPPRWPAAAGYRCRYRLRARPAPSPAWLPESTSGCAVTAPARHESPHLPATSRVRRAAVGFISLFGVAVMSGVLYISEINRRRAEPGTSLEDAVIHGARAQLRRSLMLILVAMLGMAPAARATGIGSDIQRPLATVVVGGLLSTLFLTLLVLPSLYYLTAKKEDR